jgi:FkbM family methyltransferase
MNLTETIDLLVRMPQPGRESLPWLSRGVPVALYGAGSVGRDSLRVLTQAGVVVRYFLDRMARSGQTLAGIPVLRPDDAALSPSERSATPVIVTIFNAYVEMPPLHEQLRRLGWKSVTTFLEFYQPFARELCDRFWLTGLHFYRPHAAALTATAGLWADDRSRQLFERILRFRATGDYSVLPAPDSDCQYFPGDLPAWPTPLRFVDCGACDGDTVAQLVKLGLPVEALAAFEPDDANFTKLAAALSSLPASVATVAAWPCGLSSETTQLRFDAGHGAGSAISPAGSQVIQCVALDQVLPTFQPNLIKMDIEGAEYDALLGARGTIHRHRPGVAVCLYHRPEHLWQIPLLLHGWDLGYRFYLRCHCYNGFELVLYAVPANCSEK